MKVYKEVRGKHILYVQPGIEDKETTDFKDVAGHPILFSVKFEDGVAEVTDSVGKYLIANKLARKSKVILPEGITV